MREALSYEMVRSLVTRLPVMITPRWVRVLTQPIAIADVLAYLVAARDLPEAGGRRLRDRRARHGVVRRPNACVRERRGLHRVIIPVPVLSTRLSSLWLALVTPLYARVGRHLVESVRNETVVHDDRALRDMPVRPRGVHAGDRRGDRRGGAPRDALG